jgi:hypothetical protein
MASNASALGRSFCFLGRQSAPCRKQRRRKPPLPVTADVTPRGRSRAKARTNTSASRHPCPPARPETRRRMRRSRPRPTRSGRGPCADTRARRPLAVSLRDIQIRRHQERRRRERTAGVCERHLTRARADHTTGMSRSSMTACMARTSCCPFAPDEVRVEEVERLKLSDEAPVRLGQQRDEQGDPARGDVPKTDLVAEDRLAGARPAEDHVDAAAEQPAAEDPGRRFRSAPVRAPRFRDSGRPRRLSSSMALLRGAVLYVVRRRQSKGEDTPLPLLALDGDTPAVRLDDRLGDRKPSPMPPCRVSA